VCLDLLEPLIQATGLPGRDGEDQRLPVRRARDEDSISATDPYFKAMVAAGQFVEGTIVGGHGGWVVDTGSTTAGFRPWPSPGPWRPASGVRSEAGLDGRCAGRGGHAPRCTNTLSKRLQRCWEISSRGTRPPGSASADHYFDPKCGKLTQAGPLP